jgi:hypothetical protein
MNSWTVVLSVLALMGACGRPLLAPNGPESMENGERIELRDGSHDFDVGVLESRTKTLDALLHEWKSDLLRIWIPLVAGGAMLIGLFGGMEIQGCRDAGPTAVTMPTEAPVPTAQPPEVPSNGAQADNPKPRGKRR